MKTIKSKLRTSLMSMIIIIPIIMILIFNLFMNMYLYNTSRRELKNTVRLTQEYIKNTQAKSEDLKLYQDISLMLESSQNTKNIKLLVFNNLQNNIYHSPNNYFDNELINQISKFLSSSTKSNIDIIRASGERYYVARFYVKNRKITKPNYFVLVSSESNIKDYLKDINYILIITMILGLLINLYISNRLSKSISKPIIELARVAKSIGDRKFEEIRSNNNTLEINDLYKSINIMSKRLKENEEIQKKFIQDASHEMRTPLMSIQGYAEGIENNVFENKSEAAKIIKDESIRLNNIVTDLLNLSRIENGLFNKEIKNINIITVIDNLINKLEGYSLSSGKSIAFNSTFDEVIIRGEENLLSQIFINIISNSVKYANNTVTVNVENKGNYVEIIVKDDGKGIAEEDLPQIFERFYKGKSGNFGLGLSIAKAATEALNGTVEVKNDGGAKFIVKLPLI